MPQGRGARAHPLGYLGEHGEDAMRYLAFPRGYGGGGGSPLEMDGMDEMDNMDGMDGGDRKGRPYRFREHNIPRGDRAHPLGCLGKRQRIVSHRDTEARRNTEARIRFLHPSVTLCVSVPLCETRAMPQGRGARAHPLQPLGRVFHSFRPQPPHPPRGKKIMRFEARQTRGNTASYFIYSLSADVLCGE